MKIFNQQKQLAENATVELVRAKDSSLVKTALSDKTGTADFENVLFGTYILKTTLVNHEKQFLPHSAAIKHSLSKNDGRLNSTPTITQALSMALW